MAKKGTKKLLNPLLKGREVNILPALPPKLANSPLKTCTYNTLLLLTVKVPAKPTLLQSAAPRRTSYLLPCLTHTLTDSLKRFTTTTFPLHSLYWN